MRCSSAVALLALVAGHVAAQEPSALDARLSPDGTTVVARAIDDGSVRLVLVSPYDSLAEPRWLTPAGADVESATWTPDGTRVVYRAGSDGHLYVVAAGTDPTPVPLDITPGVAGEARLAGFVGDTAAMVELPGEWPDRPDLYRVPLDGGDPVLVQENDGGVARWVVEGGAARLVMREGEEGDVEVGRIRGGVIVPFYPCGAAEVCEPVGHHPDGRVWMRTSRDRTAPALVLADPLTLDVEVVRAELGVDSGAVIREDSLYTRDVERLGELLGDAEIAFHEAPTAGGGRVLVTARDGDSAELYVFDRWAGSVHRVLPLAAEAELLSLAAGPEPLPTATLVWPDGLRYLVSDGEPGLPPTDVERTIERATEGGRAVLVIVDETEVPVFPAFALDTALLSDPAFEPDLSFPMDDMDMVEATDSTVLDATTLEPIRRRASGPFALELDFTAGSVTGSVTTEGFETPVSGSTPGPLWTDGAALELLVAALPLGPGYTTEIAYFDTGLQEVVTSRLTVSGETRADTRAGDFDAYVVTLSPDADEAGEQTWLVRRSAPHTLLRATIESRDFDRTVELVEGGDSQ